MYVYVYVNILMYNIYNILTCGSKGTFQTFQSIFFFVQNSLFYLWLEVEYQRVVLKSFPGLAEHDAENSESFMMYNIYKYIVDKML